MSGTSLLISVLTINMTYLYVGYARRFTHIHFTFHTTPLVSSADHATHHRCLHTAPLRMTRAPSHRTTRAPARCAHRPACIPARTTHHCYHLPAAPLYLPPHTHYAHHAACHARTAHTLHHTATAPHYLHAPAHAHALWFPDQVQVGSVSYNANGIKLKWHA